MGIATKPLSEQLAPSWRRQRALVRAIRRRIRRGWLVRMGRVGAWYTAITSSMFAIWLERGTRGVDGSYLLQQSMALLTLSGVFVALGTAVDLSAIERTDGLEALLRQRGYTPAARQSARVVATWELVTGALLWPAVLVGVVLLGLSDSFAEVFARLLRVWAALVYAPLAGLLLAVLARWCVALSPARPRTLLLAMLVVPHLVLLATGEGASAVALLDGMLERIASLGGGIG